MVPSFMKALIGVGTLVLLLIHGVISALRSDIHFLQVSHSHVVILVFVMHILMNIFNLIVALLVLIIRSLRVHVVFVVLLVVD